jgi:primase-polymerase (primpol)-like protein
MTMPAKPATIGDPGKLPAALLPRTQQTRWVCWRWTWREDKGRWDKPPLQASNPDLSAKSNDPATWGTYAVAVAAVAAGKADGIGYMLADDDLDAVDLDHCHNPETGAIDAWAQQEIDAANGAYVEVTVSGKGLRILGVGAGGELGRKWKIPDTTNGAAIEVYRRTNRYVTISGAQIRAAPNSLTSTPCSMISPGDSTRSRRRPSRRRRAAPPGRTAPTSTRSSRAARPTECAARCSPR